MTSLTDRIATAQQQLRTLADTAHHAHSLAYDRPGITYDRPGARSNEPRLPVATVHGPGCPMATHPVDYGCDCAERIIAASDFGWADRYLQAAIHLAHADLQTSRAAQILTRRHWPPLQTVHIRRARPVVPAPHFLARICAHIQAGITPLAQHADHLPRKVEQLLVATKPSGALIRIEDAARAIPDTRNIRHRPKPCRNPCHRDLCRGLPVKHKARRLCESCLDHVHNVHRGDHGARCTDNAARRAS